MNASIDEIAVIRARLPYIDQHALSEAWFSALHLAGDTSFSEVTRERADGDAKAWEVSTRSFHDFNAPSVTGVATPRASGSTRSGEGKMVDLQERAHAPVRKSSQWVSRGALAPQRIIHTGLTLMIANARVALHIRSDGSKMSVIAICSARHVELVRRALAATIMALEMRGTRIQAAVRAIENEEV